MKLRLAFFQLFPLSIIGLLSAILWSNISSVFAQAPKQGSATIVVQITQSPRIQNISAFNLNFNAAPYIPTGLERTDNPNEGGRGIILPNDDRVPMTSASYPWSAIGRVEGLKASGEGYICTGALITPEIVLTNAHCVYDPATHQISQAIRFMPNLVNGRLQDEEDAAFAIDAYAATDFSDGGTPPHPDDWALLKLEKSLGSRYGTIGLANITSETLATNYQGKLILPGYSFDFPADNPSQTAGVHLGCSIVNEVNGVIVHDCDTRSGSSGGPILAEVDGDVRIVAVNSAEYANQETGIGLRNYGVSMSRIMTAIEQAADR
jgi:V8-like Glu-specific endopeptidase